MATQATDTRETRKKFRDAAKRQYGKEGAIEIDPGAKVSISADGGAYVQAWVWVSNATAGIED